MTTQYIIDIPSNRVIFFTEDATVQLKPGDSAILYEDVNPPPEQMTLNNAWSWKLYGRDFIRMEEGRVLGGQPVDTLAENRAEVIKALNILLNNVRKKNQNPLNYNTSVHAIMQFELDNPDLPCPLIEALAKVKSQTVDEYRKTAKEKNDEFVKMLIRTEQWYQYYLDKIANAQNVNELAVIRDEMASRNFNLDLF